MLIPFKIIIMKDELHYKALSLTRRGNKRRRLTNWTEFITQNLSERALDDNPINTVL